MYESINSDISHRIKRKDHYLANNSIWPDVLKQNFLLQSIDPYFSTCKNRLKRVYRASNIDEVSYQKILKNHYFILKKLNDIESKHTQKLESLIETIVRDFFDLDQDFMFDIKIEDQEFLDDAVEEKDDQFSNYLEITKRNKTIDKERFAYALAKGGANHTTAIINRYSDEIDTIDPSLFRYYSKIMSFQDFMPYVVDDETFEQKFKFKKYYSVIKQNDVCYVYVYAPNFVSALNQSFLALFSYFLGLKGNMSHISYDNIWNDRLGNIAWKKFIKPIKNTSGLKSFLKEVSKLQSEDFERFFKECLSGTKLYDKIIKKKGLS